LALGRKGGGGGEPNEPVPQFNVPRTRGEIRNVLEAISTESQKKNTRKASLKNRNRSAAKGKKKKPCNHVTQGIMKETRGEAERGEKQRRLTNPGKKKSKKPRQRVREREKELRRGKTWAFNRERRSCQTWES